MVIVSNLNSCTAPTLCRNPAWQSQRGGNNAEKQYTDNCSVYFIIIMRLGVFVVVSFDDACVKRIIVEIHGLFSNIPPVMTLLVWR